MKTFRVFSLLALLIANSSLLFSQAGFRVMPSFNVPLEKDYFRAGFGAAASLDWAFPLGRRWSPGILATGGFTSFPLEHVASFTIFNAGAGIFSQWRLSDKFSIRTSGDAGIYQYSWEGEGNTKLYAGGSLSFLYHVTPFLSFFIDGGYYWHSFSQRQPINNIRSGAGVHLNLSELLKPQARLRGGKTAQYNVFPVYFA